MTPPPPAPIARPSTLANSPSDQPMTQPDAWPMVRRRAAAAKVRIGCHTFRATGITAYLDNGGALAQLPQLEG
jgi:hypothetical protein